MRFLLIYLCSTSNHNVAWWVRWGHRLSYISVLHQTTTFDNTLQSRPLLSYISVLHQTTTFFYSRKNTRSCLISLFYIKPQLPVELYGLPYVVLYLCSTSNHNLGHAAGFSWHVVLYLCSTSNHNRYWSYKTAKELSYISVLHQTTTLGLPPNCGAMLSYISVLHQTTTFVGVAPLVLRCLISLFYIKPQRLHDGIGCVLGCLISLFYIKPQLVLSMTFTPFVVLYLCSTSNHNKVLNPIFAIGLSYISVLHQTTTPDRNHQLGVWLSYISVLHQTTTNLGLCHFFHSCLISLFYIKPQHGKRIRSSELRCLISLFYIKPQLIIRSLNDSRVVLYLCSTSNHNAPLDAPASVSVVLYLCSTSNHNCSCRQRNRRQLSYISVLHQTTTKERKL